MADQATLSSGNGFPAAVRSSGGDRGSAAESSAGLRSDTPAGQVVSNVTGFGENLLSLTELQARMAAVELRQNIEAVKTASVLVLSGVVIAVAAVPVVLSGVAELLVSLLAWQRGYAFLGVGAVTIVLASCCALGAAYWLKRQRLGFPLTAEEFTRNLQWVHTVLRLSGRQPSR